MKSIGGSVDVQKLDVTVESDIASVADRVKEDHGRVDLMINCAAMLHPSGMNIIVHMDTSI